MLPMPPVPLDGQIVALIIGVAVSMLGIALAFRGDRRRDE